MKRFVLIISGIFGLLAIILGAFGAHALKTILTPESLASFEVGVKYQMYHAIVLLVLGFNFSFSNRLEKSIAWSFIIGSFLFSFSIYLLSFAGAWNVNLKFMGPVTPLGGLFMITGWALLLWKAIILKKGL